jgi:hypothetical protein
MCSPQMFHGWSEPTPVTCPPRCNLARLEQFDKAKSPGARFIDVAAMPKN